jgi:hypothetical protein
LALTRELNGVVIAFKHKSIQTNYLLHLRLFIQIYIDVVGLPGGEMSA